jgi:hypothetical protein
MVHSALVIMGEIPSINFVMQAPFIALGPIAFCGM